MAHRYCLAAGFVLLAILAGPIGQAEAEILYGGGTLTQNFDSVLPTDITSNVALQPTPYTDGWQDDVNPGSSMEDDISILGWHLFHPLNPGAPENGFNEHQRFRIGTGANTGSFWGFGNSPITTTERALGSVGSTTVAADGASMYMGLQLVNTTGVTLHSFTLTYNGEQWRDGASLSAETLNFDYSTVATDDLWTLPGGTIYTAVPSLGYSSPVFSGTGNVVDGNVAGRVTGINATVTGFNWEPGEELWLRWGDPQLAGLADDGLGIDDIQFSASASGTPSTEIVSVVNPSGNSSAGTTWSNAAPPSAGNKYRIVAGDTVTLDAPFVGDYLRVNSGGTLSVGSGGNATDLRALLLDAGSLLTDSVSGDLQLGSVDANPTTLGVMVLGDDQTLTADAGSDVRIDLGVYGPGDLTVNSSGAGSDLLLADISQHDGVVNFDGSGDRVVLFRSPAISRIEMNSSGFNGLQYLHSTTGGGGTIVFDQPGTIEHFTNSAGARLVQQSTLIANAAVTVDLTQTYVSVSGGDERRLNFTETSAFEGSGNVTVLGTSSNPTDVGLGISLNEFEIGSTAEPGTIQTDTYSGTLSALDYVNVELRHNLPAARVVVGNNARTETGHQVVGTAKTLSLGEVEVTEGGILEVGFEQVQNGTGNNGTGNHVGHLTLVDTNGRTGSLTLTPDDPIDAIPLGSTLVMQVNGKNANQFDTIAAKTATLDGVLKILVNPPSSILGAPTATPPVPATRNPIYNPALGDIIPLITASGSGTLTADFDDSLSVNGADLTIWRGAYGSTAAGDADGDLDSDGNDFLAWQQQQGSVATGGISGTFDSVVFVDINNGALVPLDPHPDTTPAVLVDSAGVITGTGLKFQVQYTSTAVNLVVVSAAATAVPEPAGALLAAVSAIALTAARRRRA